MIKVLKHWIKEHCFATIAIVVFILGLVLFIPCVREWFWNETKSIADVFTYIGIASGGIVLLGNLITSERRNKIQDDNNQLIRKGQLDTRFKDAALLLTNVETAIAGIYALNQIAMEASKIDEQKDYVRVIKEVLCSYMRQHSKIEIETDKYFNKQIRKAKRKKQYDIIFKTIIDVLFVESVELYQTYPANLNECVLDDLFFFNVNLENVNLCYSSIRGIFLVCTQFINSNLSNSDLRDITTLDTYFMDTDLSKVDMSNAYLPLTCFIGGCMKESKFVSSDLEFTDFSDSNIDETTIFLSTIHENKSIAQIKEYKFQKNETFYELLSILKEYEKAR
jgi:hypothetical protein